MNPIIDKTWHLGETAAEIKLTDFEFHLWRVFYGFMRWQEDCEKIANQTDLTAGELSILHVVRMKERPKTLNELMRLLNRDDNFNITYSIKKLTKNGLIRKITGDKHNKKTFSYEVTEAGIENIDAYSILRKNVLIELFAKKRELNLDKVSAVLSELIAVYEEADRIVLSYMSSSSKPTIKNKIVTKVVDKKADK